MKIKPHDKVEDILLVDQTLCGNQAAFEKLLIKYRPMIFDLVIAYVKNSADAEDLTQEVFLKAYQNLSSLEEPKQFFFWLRRIAQNHCIDWLRRRRENHLSLDEIKAAESKEDTKISPSLAQRVSSPEEIALKHELREIVWKAIDSLLEIDRKLMKARYFENASLKHLQVEHGLSYPAVVNRLKRAKQKVCQNVQKLLGGLWTLPSREVLKKLMSGGIEIMKFSLKSKLVGVGVAMILGLGSTGIWLWHSNEVPPKDATTKHDVTEKKVASTTANSQVQIHNSTSKVKLQPDKSSLNNQKQISDEEWKQIERWLSNPEPANQQLSKDKDAFQSEQNEKISSGFSEEIQSKYQALKEIFGQMNGIHEEFIIAVLESKSAGEEWKSAKEYLLETGADKRALKMEDIKFMEKEYSFIKKLKDIYERWISTYEQIDQIIPGATVKKEIDRPGGRSSTEYSINHEYIESMIGKMPADVETAFIPHAKGRSLRIISPEQLEIGRLRLERARESIKEITEHKSNL